MSEQISRGFINWQANRIRQAAEGACLTSAIDRIEQLWQDVDYLDGVAEAKMRLLLARCAPLDLAKLDPAIGELTEEIAAGSGDALVHPQALQSAIYLFRALPTIQVTPTLEPTGDGALEVDWGGSAQLTWVVSVPRIPWPGVSVRAYAREKGSHGPVQVKPFHQAFGLLKHAREHLD